jgi:hypothetical protein
VRTLIIEPLKLEGLNLLLKGLQAMKIIHRLESLLVRKGGLPPLKDLPRSRFVKLQVQSFTRLVPRALTITNDRLIIVTLIGNVLDSVRSGQIVLLCLMSRESFSSFPSSAVAVTPGRKSHKT